MRVEAEAEAFIDEAGRFFSGLGLSPTAGRVMGVLLAVAGADGADAPQLCAALGVAKSSMSVALGRLEQAGLVERRRPRGERRDRYRLTDDVFARAFRSKMAEFDRFQRLAEHGLALVGDDPPRRRRLENMRDMYAFMGDRFPALLDEWERSRTPR